MHEEAKYLIHADITANGVVERSDVVGAVFGQTEGLLGEELDLRELQDTSKVGRIDVDVTSERGQSFGEITIASGLDRVETAILAASLETIERVGPCRATIEVSGLEDVRSAKRRSVVERATELLADFEAEAVTSSDIVDAVRERVRVEDVTEYEGVPAGPRVADSDAVVVVEGRADVLQLLEYGIKNAVAVEGTDVPDAVADLTTDRTTTAFLDGDRGGELILRELAQVGDLEYVAFAPAGTGVEELSREQALTALREKVPYDAVTATGADGRPTDEDVQPTEAFTAGDVPDGDDSVVPADGGTAIPARTAPEEAPEAVDSGPDSPAESPVPVEPRLADEAVDEPPAETVDEPLAEAVDEPQVETGDADVSDVTDVTDDARDSEEGPATVAGHARAVIGEGRALARLLDDDAAVLAEGSADEAFDLLEATGAAPATLVLDDAVDQRLLDVAAQRGVEQVVAAGEGEFVKRPTSVRIRPFEDV